jgi:GcrA cell cycle regulator
MPYSARRRAPASQRAKARQWARAERGHVESAATSNQEKPMQRDGPWTDFTIAKLRSLWEDGLSTSAIGRALKLSKNAVIGKAHRLDLPARPYPIKPANGQRQNRIRKPRPRVSLPPLPPPVCLPPGSDVHETGTETDTNVLAGPKASPPAITPAIEKPTYRFSQCCWPIGDPGTPAFRFCDAPAIPGKPYCAAHASRAYVNASLSGRKVA